MVIIGGGLMIVKMLYKTINSIKTIGWIESAKPNIKMHTSKSENNEQ
jgi:hypothetical protein